ncbi:hypothetical protein KPL78_21115 [Roseomonas sp. HJA6]|jgi:uncharacterized protein YjiS (DUF1127 family)|nr:MULTISPECIES: hypothetical protein [Neoroseomonas]MBW6400374.1 hypothetical protein [Neoroseomonas alba]
MRLAIEPAGPTIGMSGTMVDHDRAENRIAHLVALVRLWMQRYRERRALVGYTDLDVVSDHILRDLGLTRAEARAECRKPFWRQ